MTAAVTADQASHGRTVITSRAVRRVVSAVTAEALDAKSSDVSVELTDRDGGLTLGDCALNPRPHCGIFAPPQRPYPCRQLLPA